MDCPTMMKFVWAHLGAQLDADPLEDMLHEMGLTPYEMTDAELRRWERASNRVKAECWRRGKW